MEAVLLPIGFRFLTGGHAVHGWENKRVSVAQETPMPPGRLNCKNPNQKNQHGGEASFPCAAGTGSLRAARVHPQLLLPHIIQPSPTACGFWSPSLTLTPPLPHAPLTLANRPYRTASRPSTWRPITTTRRWLCCCWRRAPRPTRPPR